MAKKVEVIITCNTKAAGAAVQAMTKELKKAETTLLQLQNAGKGDSTKAKKLKQEINELKSAITDAQTATTGVNRVMKDLSNATLKQLNSALRQAKKELDGMSGNNPKLKEQQQLIRQLQGQIDNVTGSVRKQGSAWDGVVKNMTAYFGLFAMFNKAKSMITDFYKKNFELSDQLANIRKVSGLTTEQVDSLQTHIAKIDSRSGVQELNNLAYAGSRLGMGEYGVAGLAAFTRAADKVNVALKEDLGDEALTQLAKMTEVMGLIPKMGVESAMEATGSAIFKLASTSTANGEHIVQMAERLVGLGKASNVTTDQLLGLASAADSMMLSPEVAATAFSKMMTSLQTSYNLIEKDLGMTEGHLKNLLEEGKTMQAIVDIIEAMGQKGGMNQLNFMFKDLGSDGARIKNVLVTMSQNVDMLKKHLDTSRVAFSEATAVGKEYAIQQETAQAIMERANNLWEKAFVNPDGVNTVKGLSSAWYELSHMLTGSEGAMESIKMSISAVTTALKGLVYILPALITFVVGRGLVAGLVSLKTALFGSAAGAQAAAAGFRGLVNSFKNASKVAKANWIVFILSTIIELVMWIKNATEAEEDLEHSFDESRVTTSRLNAEISGLSDEAKRYADAITNAKKGTDEYAAAISKFNEKFGDYYNNLLTEADGAERVASAYAEVCKNMELKHVLSRKEKAVSERVNPLQDAADDALSGYNAQSKVSYTENGNKLDNGQYGGAWLKGVIEDGRKLGLAGEKLLEYVQKQMGKDSVIETDEAWGQRETTGKSSVKDESTYSDQFGVHKMVVNRDANANEQLVIDAARVIFAQEKVDDARKDIEQQFEPWQSDIDAYYAKKQKDEEKRLQGLKDAQNKQDAKEQKKKEKQDLSNASGEIPSVIGKISAFYKKQQEEFIRGVNEKGMDITEELQQEYLEVIQRRMQEAMAKARTAIYNGSSEDWNSFVETMWEDIRAEVGTDGYKLSKALIDEISSIDPAKIRDVIVTLTNKIKPGSGLSQLDNLLASAQQNELNIAKSNNRSIRKEQEAIIDEDPREKVNEKYRSRMDIMKLPRMSDEEVSISMSGGDAMARFTEERKREMIDMFQTAYENYTSLMSIDPSAKGSNGLIANLLFGNDPTKLSSVAQSMRNSVLKMSTKEIVLFYKNLRSYSQDYYKAVEEHDKRIKETIDSDWKRSDVKRLFDQRIQQLTLAARQYMAAGQQGKNNVTYRQQPKNTRTQYGFADNIDKDPEVQLIYKKMQLEQAYLNFMIANHATKEQLADQEAKVYEAQAAMADAVTKRIDERFTALRKWVEPIEAMGTAVGDAFATMTDSAEDGRKALINALKAMLQAYGQMSIQMVSDNLNDRLRARNKARGVEATTNTADVGKSVASSVVGSAQSAISTAVGGASQPGATDPNAAPEVQSRVNIDNALYQEQLSHNQRTEEEERRHQEEMARLKGQPSPASDASTGPSASPDVTTATVPSASPDGSEKDEKAAAKETLKSYGLQSAEAALKKGLNRLFNLKRRAKRKELKLEREYQSQETDVVEQGGEAQLGFTETFQGEMADVTQQVSQKIVTTKQQAAQANMQTEMAEAQGTTAAGVAEGASQTIGQLGWWGIPLVAVITALLNGLLAFAMSKFSSLFGGSSSGSSSNTKLVSGMLTYDRGNVQQFASLTDRTKARRITESDLLRASQAYADGDMSAASRLVVGDDGNIYDAQAAGALMTGIVSSPTTTTIGGQPALVGERGPEMVIGRETTRALQLARPDLLAEIIRFDRNHSGAGFRAYDRGNVASFDSQSIDAQASSQPSTQFDAAALTATISTLQRTLADLQRTGIQASINMYGSDGLHSRLRQADRFMSGK